MHQLMHRQGSPYFDFFCNFQSSIVLINSGDQTNKVRKGTPRRRVWTADDRRECTPRGAPSSSSYGASIEFMSPLWTIFKIVLVLAI
jgi:hypothetical protein